MVVAVACGGSGSGNTRSIAGAIDSSVLSKSTLTSGTYEVWAEQAGTKVKKGVISVASSSSEDSTYSVDGLTDGVTYEIVVYRVVGFDRISVMSTVATASSTSGSLTKASGLGKVSYKRQINMVSTYVTKKYVVAKASSSSVTLSSITTTVFGSSSVSLDTVVSVNGQLATTAGIGLAIVDSVATAAVSQLTFATVAMASMSATSAASQASTFASFASTMSTATTTTSILSATASSMTGFINAAVASTSVAAFTALAQSADKIATASFATAGTNFVTAMTSITTASTTVFANVLATSFSLNIAVASVAGGSFSASVTTAFFVNMGNGLGVSAANLQTQASVLANTAGAGAGLPTATINIGVQFAADPTAPPPPGGVKTDIKITSFGLAHATAYGITSGNAFIVNTLSPVFKLVASTTLPATATSLVDVTVTNMTTGASQVLSAMSTKVTSVQTTDNTTAYLMVYKSGAVASTASTELQPGTTYKYVITAKTNVQYSISAASSSVPMSGTITTTDITFTLPFTGTGSGNYSLVNLTGTSSFKGVPASTALSFWVASKNYIQYLPSSTSTYGIIGSSGNITVTLNGSSSVAASGNTLTIANISTGTTAGWAKGFKITLAASQLTTGSQYIGLAFKSGGNVNYTVADDGTSDGSYSTSSANTVLPSRIDLTVQ